MTVVPFSLRDAPALIEKILPVQKLSAEAYKEQMAGAGKTLTALGSYWKGRKPLILNKAVVLGCLLPATDNLQRDLEIFEMLMAMDDESFRARLKGIGIGDILAKVPIKNIHDYFVVEPEDVLPRSAPFDLSAYEDVKVKWRPDVTDEDWQKLELDWIARTPYRERVEVSKRPEEMLEDVHKHIWVAVNAHLGTTAQSFPELVEQLGVMRFGHRPRVADTFCGSGQIPFEAARLGCDVYASDLNPVACMLTWGAFNIVGGSEESQIALAEAQQKLGNKVQTEIDLLGIETDGQGWRGKVYLYCLEARCPQTGWLVPLLPSLVISKPRTGDKVYGIAELVPDIANKRYNIAIRSGVTGKELSSAESGTVRSDGHGQDSHMVHTVNGMEYRTKISTLRGDYIRDDGSTSNQLRLWERSDFKARVDDVFQERLYAVQWMRPKKTGNGYEYEFRSATEADLERERVVEKFLADNFAEWQAQGWLPDMRIESGVETERLYRERGWTHWHHLFNPRQLLVAGLTNRYSDAAGKVTLTRLLNKNSRLSRWDPVSGGGGSIQGVFDNQALNTLYNYGTRGSRNLENIFGSKYRHVNIGTSHLVKSLPAYESLTQNDLYITDPPYGDAVKYEEILEFFIAWLRKNPPPEFAGWVWDSRRALAIKGEDEEFRQNMVAAYRNMAEHMPDNGLQVIMFTHQSGSIWGDMANIVWAAGLQVTAAWYVVTETESALRQGNNVKGTVLLVLRKRGGALKATRDDLAWEIQEEVEEQVQTLTGLSQKAKGWYRDDNLFEDADLQMAGYAAALRVLTKYAIINGKDMAAEAARPRVKGQTTLVDELIEFAVGVANQSLVPLGIEKAHWDRLQPTERFYLKLIELEARGQKTLDNYQNFAKAFKVENFKPLMASEKANAARLKSAVDLGRTEMNESSEFYNTVLRGVLYALMELVKNKEGDEVLAHLALNIPTYYDQTQRDVIVEFSTYLAGKLATLRPDEASAARVLGELVRNQRM